MTKAAVCTFGGIEWDAIACEGDCVLLLAHDAVEIRPFHDRKRCPEWNKSALRAYLNGGFLERFSERERASIRPVLVVNGASTRRTGHSSDTVDRVFLLSSGEVRSIDPELRRARCRWWLRTPGADSYYISHVEPRGTVSSFGSTAIAEGVGVRPAMWVSLEGVQSCFAEGFHLASLVNEAAERCSGENGEESGGLVAEIGEEPAGLVAEIGDSEPTAWAFAALDAATKLRVEADYLASLADGLRPLNPLFHDHAVRQSKKLLELALSRKDSGDVLAGMIREGLVTARNIDEILERVTRLGDVDLMAMLLDFKNKGLAAEDLEREERRRENEALRLFNPWSAEELKKLWRFRKTEEGIVLEEYLGEGPFVSVPETIGRMPVFGFECSFPADAVHLILPDVEPLGAPFAGAVHASDRFAAKHGEWLSACGGYELLPFGEGCTPEAYIPAAQMRQGKIRMMTPAEQSSRFGCVVFGRYAWDIVRENDRAMLLLARDIVARRPYNRVQADADWAACTLRTWLSSEFLDTLTIREKQQMLKVPARLLDSSCEDRSEACDREQVLAQVDSWLDFAEPLESEAIGDAAFVLSSHEAKELLSQEERSASASWWLRDAGEGPKSAAYVLASGRFFDLGGYVSSPRMGVRPVLVVAK